MLKTALSMLPGTLAVSGYNVVDTFFVSRLGTLPMAAMSFTFPIIMLIGCLFRGIDNGILTPMAQLLGAGKKHQAARLISSGIILMSIVALLVAIAGIFSVKVIFQNLLGANNEVMDDIGKYMNIWYLGSVTAALGMAGNGLLVAAGTPRAAGLMMLGGLFLNMLLDPLFIFGWGPIPGMGVAGAALATVIAQSIGMAGSLCLLHFKMHLIASFKIPLKLLFSRWLVICRYGIPAACAMLLIPIGSAVVTWAVGKVGGNDAVAAVGAAGRIEVLAFVFPMSLGIALLPMIGQNYGARQWERINQCRRFSMRFAGVMLFVMAVVYFFAAPYCAKILSDNREVQELMIVYLRIIPWGFAGIEVHRFGGFFLTGCAHPVGAAVLNGGRVLFLLIPLTLLGVYANSLYGIFWARLVTDITAGIAGLICARLITRKQLYSMPFE